VPESITALIAGLQHLLALPTFLYLIAGAVIGFIVGVLPGLGGPATMALLFPALLQVAPLDACVLITAVAAVSSAAGDLTSILLGVPGEATSAAVVPDGHAMAMQGQGGRALGAAITSALLGSLFGALVLVTFVPVARPLIDYMQSPELAALALLGICLLIPLSRADAVRGFLSGALGLSLATVGLDPTFGQPRFTFGQLTLWDGLGLLPMALGIRRARGAGDDSKRQNIPSSADSNRRASCAAVAKSPPLGWRAGAAPLAPQLASCGCRQCRRPMDRMAANQTSKSQVPAGSGAIEGVIGPPLRRRRHRRRAALTLALAFLEVLPRRSVVRHDSEACAGPSMLVADRLGGHLTLVFAPPWRCERHRRGDRRRVTGWVARLHFASLAPVSVVLTFVPSARLANVMPSPISRSLWPWHRGRSRGRLAGPPLTWIVLGRSSNGECCFPSRSMGGRGCCVRASFCWLAPSCSSCSEYCERTRRSRPELSQVASECGETI
jgi:hypothetical protein